MSDCSNCGAPLPPSATAEYADRIAELQGRLKEERRRGREEMRRAAVSIINDAREEGEPDIRTVRGRIESCRLDESGRRIGREDEADDAS